MGKNVLIISASPRKGGNSDILCDQFAKGATDAGNYAEKIFINEKKINYCRSCWVCINNKKGCVQKDDMAELLEKMIAADVIVMATPVYFYTMCAQLKTLIDRTFSRYTEINNKEFYFILTAADTSKRNMNRTVEGFRGFISCLNGAQEKGIIYGTGAWESGDIKKLDAFTQSYQMGKNV